jgi:hypothetical protein
VAIPRASARSGSASCASTTSAPGARERQAAGARLKKEALDRMELVYYETALLPYARPNGVYARAPSPSGCSTVAFGPAMKPSRDMLMSMPKVLRRRARASSFRSR